MQRVGKILKGDLKLFRTSKLHRSDSKFNLKLNVLVILGDTPYTLQNSTRLLEGRSKDSLTNVQLTFGIDLKNVLNFLTLKSLFNKTKEAKRNQRNDVKRLYFKFKQLFFVTRRQVPKKMCTQNLPPIYCTSCKKNVLFTMVAVYHFSTLTVLPISQTKKCKPEAHNTK